MLRRKSTEYYERMKWEPASDGEEVGQDGFSEETVFQLSCEVLRSRQ